MIEITENRDPAGIKLMERAGLDPKQYISVLNESTYLHAMNIDTGEFVIIEKETAKVVKSPGALACSPGHKKIKTNQIIGQSTEENQVEVKKINISEAQKYWLKGMEVYIAEPIGKATFGRVAAAELLLVLEEGQAEAEPEKETRDKRSGSKSSEPPKRPRKKAIDRGKIEALHMAGWTNKKIADEMQCSESGVSMILKELREKGETE